MHPLPKPKYQWQTHGCHHTLYAALDRHADYCEKAAARCKTPKVKEYWAQQATDCQALIDNIIKAEVWD